MTATETPKKLTPVSPPARKGNPWFPTFRGTALVAGIELRRRKPTAKGYVVYGLLFAVVIGICLLAARMSTSDLSSTNLELVLVMVLGVGMLVAPSLSATSINGDSREGVLAPLQMTHLTAGDIAYGKLLASWLVSVIALLALSPFLVFAYLKSGWELHELAITIGAILLVVLAFTAVGLAWSALAARSVASVSLAHLTTGFFAVGTLVLYFMAGMLVTDTKEVTNRHLDYDAISEEQSEALEQGWMTGDFSAVNLDEIQCLEEIWTEGVPRTDEVVGFLLVNPVVMIAETAPIVDPQTWKKDGRAAPGMFASIHSSVASERLGPQEDVDDYRGYDECAEIRAQVTGEGLHDEMTEEEWEALWAEEQARADAFQQRVANMDRMPWWGITAQVVLFFGSMTLVIARLRVPYKKLRSGTRVA